MLSVGVTGLRRETGRQWHLAVINEVTFPTAPAAIEKNLFHFKVTSRGMCGGALQLVDGRLVGSVGRSGGASKCNMRNWWTVSDADNLRNGSKSMWKWSATTAALTSGAHGWENF